MSASRQWRYSQALARNTMAIPKSKTSAAISTTAALFILLGGFTLPSASISKSVDDPQSAERGKLVLKSTAALSVTAMKARVA